MIRPIVRPVHPATIDAPWDKWTPTTSEPWNRERVFHLHRRAGFAATKKELDRDVNAGPEATIARFLEGRVYESLDSSRFEKRARVIGDAAAGSNNSSRLEAWWLYRMIYSQDPLGEKLALLWHNHFATSHAKVRNLRLMYRQNHLFREHGRGRFGELFSVVVKDPAILVYLDANHNRAAHPNENLGREMLELFSLGEGNYSETDVRETARALTGWTVKNESFQFVPERHDPREKRMLGHTGKHRGDDAIRIAVEHPATARRIAGRICDLLLGEEVIGRNAFNELVSRFRDNDLQIDWLVATILRSRLFFSPANIGNRVLGPAEYIVGWVRMTGAMDPSPGTAQLARAASRMGQRLFHPPNVFGYPGGRKWITSQWMIARSRFVHDLVNGKLHRQPFDLRKSLAWPEGNSFSSSDVNEWCQTFLGVHSTGYLANYMPHRSDDPVTTLLKIMTSPYAHTG